MGMKKIHFILENAKLIASVKNSLKKIYAIDYSTNLIAALQFLRTNKTEFVFIDINILQQAAEGSNYKAVLQTFGFLSPNISIVVMVEPRALKEAVRIVNEGADSYLTYPLVSDEIQLVVNSILEQSRAESELNYLREQIWQEDAFDLVQTKSLAMKNVFENIRAVASTKSTVLLLGETGTGKGFTARFIHTLSLRKNERFIEVHCGAIPDTLVESEMFGHEKGAFTGAIKRKLGKFEIAKGGTIFLDEIGTITPAAQIKLLQVLQDGIFQRVGGEEEIHADVRIITATNIDLKQLCEEKQFRNDLYYRLNVFPIELPPLRERKEDIPKLVELFLNRLNTFHVKGIQDIHPKVLDAFLSYSWPGNIRELENIMERAYILEKSSVMRPESFPIDLFSQQMETASANIDPSLTLSQVRKQEMARVEQTYLDMLLKQHKGKINSSARAAGITTRQLHKLMTRHSLRKEEYKSGATSSGL